MDIDTVKTLRKIIKGGSDYSTCCAHSFIVSTQYTSIQCHYNQGAMGREADTVCKVPQNDQIKSRAV